MNENNIFGIYKKMSTGEEMLIDMDTFRLTLAIMAKSENMEGRINFDSDEKIKEFFKLIRIIQRGRNLLKKQIRYEVTEDHSSSGHFYYSPEERLSIVVHFFKDKKEGKILNQDSWAQVNYHISGRTLQNYKKEFKDFI